MCQTLDRSEFPKEAFNFKISRFSNCTFSKTTVVTSYIKVSTESEIFAEEHSIWTSLISICTSASKESENSKVLLLNFHPDIRIHVFRELQV